MRIKLEAVKLERPILLGGKNFGNTIEVAKNVNLELEYDSDEKEVWMKYNGRVGIIPMGNVDVLVPAHEETKAAEPPPPPAPAPARGKIRAQVSGPQQHVFEGPGHGQTGVNLKT